MKLSIDAPRDAPSVTSGWQALGTAAIHGVVARETAHVVTNNGVLTELLRREWLGSSPDVQQVFLRTIDPGGVSAWHVHHRTVDRLFCIGGRALVILYDARQSSPTHGTLAEYRLAQQRPTLLIVPPGVFHGVKALGSEPAAIVNMVDEAYSYSEPDHWRLPADSADIPYRFEPRHPPVTNG